MRKRRHSLFLMVVFHGPEQVIAKMPTEFVRWAETRQRLYEMMRERFRTQAKDILSVEGIAGYPMDQAHEEDANFLEICHLAFAGSPDHLSKFNLYAWDDETRTFKFVRAPTVSQLESV